MISLKAGSYPQNNIVFLLRQLFFRLKGTEAPLTKMDGACFKFIPEEFHWALLRIKTRAYLHFIIARHPDLTKYLPISWVSGTTSKISSLVELGYEYISIGKINEHQLTSSITKRSG